MQPKLFHLHALSALHCGTGQSAEVVDLPIARARATQLPIVPGSSLRGVLREHTTARDDEITRTLFGTSDKAGALAVGDAHLLILPVRCLAGIVSYVTSPFILRRYGRDLERTGCTLDLPDAPAEGTAKVTPGSLNCIGDTNKLVLEDLDLQADEDNSLIPWADHISQAVHPGDVKTQIDFTKRFALLPDKVMCFLAETATEIRTRIVLNQDTGTVRKGGLWNEENLPAEAVLWGILALSESNNTFQAALPDAETLLQLGGNAGVGSGLVRFLK